MLKGLYVVDTETDGLDFVKNSVIEVSIIRVEDQVQKTWCIKPLAIENISTDALRVNGHKLEDLLHKTPFGRETYRDASKVIVEIENWLMEDNLSSDSRWMIGQNVQYDKNMLEFLWKKCNAHDSFPFGRRMIDTMQFEVFMDLAAGTKSESYSLNSIIKKYGIKNEKAHTAAADTKATAEVFLKQLDVMKKLVSK